MSDLIERLERGERWDGDNAEVLRALDIEHLVSELIPPEPLNSVDDALGLVPEDAVSHHHGKIDGWECEIYVQADGYIKLFEGAAETLAIALTIAILKASHIQE